MIVRHAKEIGKLAGGMSLSVVVEIVNMMVFRVLGSFCKSVPRASVAVVWNCCAFMGNVRSGIRAK